MILTSLDSLSQRTVSLVGHSKAFFKRGSLGGQKLTNSLYHE